MKMIVGLGNPDKKYSKTRHNTGFIILDEIVADKGLSWEKSPKLKSDICKTGDFLFVKPATFMNKSGEAVSLVKEYFGVELGDICVVHDDVDLLGVPVDDFVLNDFSSEELGEIKKMSLALFGNFV